MVQMYFLVLNFMFVSFLGTSFVHFYTDKCLKPHEVVG